MKNRLKNSKNSSYAPPLGPGTPTKLWGGRMPSWLDMSCVRAECPRGVIGAVCY